MSFEYFMDLVIRGGLLLMIIINIIILVEINEDE